MQATIDSYLDELADYWRSFEITLSSATGNLQTLYIKPMPVFVSIPKITPAGSCPQIEVKGQIITDYTSPTLMSVLSETAVISVIGPLPYVGNTIVSGYNLFFYGDVTTGKIIYIKDKSYRKYLTFNLNYSLANLIDGEYTETGTITLPSGAVFTGTIFVSGS